MCGGCNSIHISDANSLRLFPFSGARFLKASVLRGWGCGLKCECQYGDGGSLRLLPYLRSKIS